MPVSLRIDRAPITKHEKLPDGRLRVMATFSRVGPLDYLRADGSIQTEYVTADELFRQDSLDTAALAPVTLGHPDVGLVTPQNWKKYAVGSSGSTITARQDAGLVDVVYVINDADAIEAVESGRADQVSMGYQTVVERRDDKFYQTNRKYNHHALVPRGRAGASVKVHMDSGEDFAVQVNNDKEDIQMPKIKGVEVAQLVFDEYQAVLDERNTLKTDAAKYKADAEQLPKVTAERDVLQAKVDSQAQELKTKMDSAEVTQAAQARLDAFANAKPYLPKETKFDAKVAPIEWMKQALTAANPKLKLDGKSDEYVTAGFEMLATLGTSETQRQKRTDDVKATLDAAAAGGDRSGPSLERSDEDWDAQMKADEAAINAQYAGTADDKAT